MSPPNSIAIDFLVDEACLAAMRRTWNGLHHKTWAYGSLLFDAPVRLKIGDVVLLDSVSAPLGTVAALGLERIERLTNTQSAELNLPGTSYHLDFQLDVGMVKVTERRDKGSATISYEELVDAWRTFAEKVRRLITAEFPEVLERDDQIGAWFRSDVKF